MKKMNMRKLLENKGKMLKLTTLGFTLVELLAVIVILAIVLIIAVPGVLSIINSTKENAYKSQLKMIKEAARTYITTNKQFEQNNQIIVNLSDLQTHGYIDKKIIDPRNKKEMTAISVVVTRKGNKMNYDIVYSDSSNANYPVYTDGMIPIVYDGTNWVKANVTNENQTWFDYSKQKWANVATVTDDVRDDLLSAKTDTIVPMDKINTMFVWIPRFKYKLFNVDGTISPANNPNLINDLTLDIKFESRNGIKSIGTKNGEYLTHPAFAFGNEEIAGYWVGKFETGYNQGVDPNTYTTTGAEKNEIEPSKILIKPNIYSWRNVSVYKIFKNAKQMNDASNIFGFKGSVDSHMIKNMEWAALAYLTSSKYGKTGNPSYTGAERQVRINNNNAYLTGCGADAQDAAGVATCNTYETAKGVTASTTGNITGVYDTSGGAWEYVAGVMKSETGTFLSPYSEFPVEELNDLENEGKYLDVYSYGSSPEDHSRYHIGDATLELSPQSIKPNSSPKVINSSWYLDQANFLNQDFSWFFRGGATVGKQVSGTFAFRPWRGNNYLDEGGRIVIN